MGINSLNERKLAIQKLTAKPEIKQIYVVWFPVKL
jgi:hypothetical protein